MIRPFQPADAEGALRLTREVLPLRVETAASVLRQASLSRCWVAEEDGELVGLGRVRGRKLWIGVAAAARRRGIGGELWARVEEHVDEPATCWAEGDAGIAFARDRGFSPTHRVLVLTLDVASVPPAEVEVPSGVALVAWSGLERVPPELDAEEDAAAPQLLPDASVAAVVGGAPVAYALLGADEHGLAENLYTFTLPAYRGRGLATLCKREALERARARGVHTLATATAETNAPMLAVNRRLGYREHHVRTTLTRV